MENKLIHAAERKAFEVAIDSLIKHVGNDPTNMVKIINIGEKFIRNHGLLKLYEKLKAAFSDENSKWQNLEEDL